MISKANGARYHRHKTIDAHQDLIGCEVVLRTVINLLQIYYTPIFIHACLTLDEVTFYIDNVQHAMHAHAKTSCRVEHE